MPALFEQIAVDLGDRTSKAIVAGLPVGRGGLTSGGGFFELFELTGFAFGLNLDELAAGGVEETHFALFVNAEEVDLMKVVGEIGGLSEFEVEDGVAVIFEMVLKGADHGEDGLAFGADLLRGPGDFG